MEKIRSAGEKREFGGRSKAVSWLMHGLWSGISRIFTPLSKEFYVRSAHSRAALTPQTGSMTPLNLLPQRFVSKPQAEWLLHGAAISLHGTKKEDYAGG